MTRKPKSSPRASKRTSGTQFGRDLIRSAKQILAHVRGEKVLPSYTVLIEEGPTSFGASVSELPGCVAVAKTREKVMDLISDAVEMHLKGMHEDGDEIPIPAKSRP